MREILFRGKLVNGGDWVEGSYHYSADKSKHYILNLERFLERSYHNGNELAMHSGEVHEVIPETVGQFTGLNDKNGKNIFEGDILLGMEEGNGETTAWEQVRYKIEFNPKSTAFVGVEIGVDNWDIEISDINTYYEIIGNIHDNPELIK